jgi:hypothetical protein
MSIPARQTAGGDEYEDKSTNCAPLNREPLNRELDNLSSYLQIIHKTLYKGGGL